MKSIEAAPGEDRGTIAPGLTRSSERKRELALIALLLLTAAVVTRMATFGHPDLYVDEAFYFAAGVEMQHGAVPFVDVWDRKPVGHFLLFAAIAWISSNLLAYQLAATLFAATTALVIYVVARASARRVGALMGAITYLLGLCVFVGHGGQSAVFYNLFVAAAAALLLGRVSSIGRPIADRWTTMAMLLAGIGLTMKTTVIFEALYFGLVAAGLAIARRGLNSATVRTIALWAVVGALPTLVIALWYLIQGYWDEFWTAMVTSNLRKAALDGGSWRRLGILAAIISPLAMVALGALRQWPAAQRNFLAGWTLAALVGFFSVPAFYLHYAIPLLVPLCIAASVFFARRTLGPASFALIAAMAFVAFPYFDFERTRLAKRGMAELVAAIEQHKGSGPLLVYDGPPLLYTLTGERFPTPLAFPNHLHQEAERDVSHLSTLAEVRRVLARQPGAVVVKTVEASNRESAALVEAYIARNCRKVASVALTRDAGQRVEVHAGCDRGGNGKAGARSPGLS